MNPLTDLADEATRSFWWEIVRGRYLTDMRSLGCLALASKAFHDFIESFDFVDVVLAPASNVYGGTQRCGGSLCKRIVPMTVRGEDWVATFRKGGHGRHRTRQAQKRNDCVTEMLKPSPYVFDGHHELIVTARLLLHAERRQRLWEIRYHTPFRMTMCSTCGSSGGICEEGSLLWCSWCAGYGCKRSCHSCNRSVCAHRWDLSDDEMRMVD